MAEILELDTETFSRTPIRHGTYRYAADAEVMLWAWAVDGGEVQVDEKLTDTLKHHIQSVPLIVMHNSMFDRNVIREAHGIDIKTSRIHDTMVQALSHGLPGSLDALCGIVGVADDLAKLKTGKKLIHLFCKPLGKNRKLDRATKETHPEQWAEFREYAKHDILAMRALRAKLPRWNYWNPGSGQPLTENLLWEMDQIINDRGFQVDIELADKAREAVRKEEKRIGRELDAETDGIVTTAGQRDKFLSYLLEQFGVYLPDLRASTVEKRLSDPDLPEEVKELLRLRAVGSLASTAKFSSIRRAVSDDGRLRGGLQFCGASRTGRWAGRVFQPQNLPKPAKEHENMVDTAIDAIKDGSYEFMFDRIKPWASSALRGLLIARPKHVLLCADLSNIEGRVAAWLGNETWRLQAYAAQDRGEGHDMYKLSYAKAFGVDVEKVDDAGRQTGKVQELALQFGGAKGAYETMSKVLRVEPPSVAKIEQIVKAFREGNKGIVGMWYDLNNAMMNATREPGTWFSAGKIECVRNGSWLRMVLPSGRSLCYASPKIQPSRFNRPGLTYMGINSYTRKWERIDTYGGKLFENAVQATARDVFVFGLKEAHKEGFPVVLTVHDEIIAEVPLEGGLTLQGLIQCMQRLPDWADGLPVAAAGFETTRYRKE